MKVRNIICAGIVCLSLTVFMGCTKESIDEETPEFKYMVDQADA